MPVSEFEALERLLPHQELRDAGKLVPWSPNMRSVFFVSHQWTSFDGPDHTAQQLRTFQQLLARMRAGTCPETAPTFADRAQFKRNIKITTAEWRTVAEDAYVWMDYISMPQVGVYHPSALSDLVKSVHSIPAYVERCTHFFVLCPTTKAPERSSKTVR